MKYIILFCLIFCVKSKSLDFTQKFKLTSEFNDIFNNFDPILKKYLLTAKDELIKNLYITNSNLNQINKDINNSKYKHNIFEINIDNIDKELDKIENEWENLKKNIYNKVKNSNINNLWNNFKKKLNEIISKLEYINQNLEKEKINLKHFSTTFKKNINIKLGKAINNIRQLKKQRDLAILSTIAINFIIPGIGLIELAAIAGSINVQNEYEYLQKKNNKLIMDSDKLILDMNNTFKKIKLMKDKINKIRKDIDNYNYDDKLDDIYVELY